MAVTRKQVAQLYVATLNRAPDAAGLDYWENSGLAIEEIAASFFDQPETQALYPAGTSSAKFVNSIYNNLFNRDAEQAGLDYWVEQLDAGNVSRDQMILAVTNGAQDTGLGSDATILANKTKVGLVFADAGLDSVEDTKAVMEGVDHSYQSVIDVKDAIDALVASEGGVGNTLILTTGQDLAEGAAANDTIYGLVDGTNDSLTFGDMIDGKGGNDTVVLSANSDDANNDGDFTEADDIVIQLAGVTTLDITDITFG